jgi:hypothetical protein
MPQIGQKDILLGALVRMPLEHVVSILAFLDYPFEDIE